MTTSAMTESTNNDTTSNTPITPTRESVATSNDATTSINATTSTQITPTSDNATQITTTSVDVTTSAWSSTTPITPAPSTNTTTTMLSTDTGNTTAVITATTQRGSTTTPAVTLTSNLTTTSSVPVESSTAELTTASLTTHTNSSPESGPTPPSSTSISTSGSPPPSTTPGSSTTPPTGNATTISPPTATSGDIVTGLTTETTETHSTTASHTTTTNPTSNTSIPTTSTTIILTTLQPTVSTTDSSTTAAPPSPGPVIVCPAFPCPLRSVCLNGTCQCLTGGYLLNGLCAPAQVFPGTLHVGSLTFEDEMANRSSGIFQRTAADISAALGEVLKNQPGYIRTDVVELRSGSVVATVNNIFENTDATEESVGEIIKAASSTSTGLLSNTTFTSTRLCEQEPQPCDVSTSKCTNVNGRPVCACAEGYVSNVYSDSSCRACPSGQKAVGETCQPCPFGYAGFNCNDGALLAVVIVSCVLGGILLILVLALLIYCCWRRCSESKPDCSRSPYSSEDSNKPWPTAISPIPRATTNWDAAPSMEMTEGGSTNTLVDKKHYSNGLSGSYDLNPEDMKTFKETNLD
ncbi:uncharacterized protein PAE49_023542 isoform 2-T2 [Odontesthes bonariensis]